MWRVVAGGWCFTLAGGVHSRTRRRGQQCAADAGKEQEQEQRQEQGQEQEFGRKKPLCLP